jgi:putative membrane protein
MSYLIQFIATAVALYYASQYIPGINFTSQSALLVFVVVLAVFNLVLGTVLRIVTFPLKFLTLGISSLAISIGMVYLTDQVVTGISLANPLTLIIVALITSVIAMLFRFFR